MPRNNILLRRLPAPKWIQLLNGRVFFAKYQRASRHALAPTQVRIATTYAPKLDQGDKELGELVIEIAKEEDNKLVLDLIYQQP